MDPLTLGIGAVAIIVLVLALIEFAFDVVKSCATTVLVVVAIIWLVNQIQCG